MSGSVPVASFLPCQFRHSIIRNIQRLEDFVKVFSIRKFKNHFFKCISIFKSILHRLVKTFYLEETFQIFKVLHKEVKKELSIVPLSKQ